MRECVDDKNKYIIISLICFVLNNILSISEKTINKNFSLYEIHFHSKRLLISLVINILLNEYYKYKLIFIISLIKIFTSNQ